MGREEAAHVRKDFPQDEGHRVHLQSGREDHLRGGEVLLLRKKVLGCSTNGIELSTLLTNVKISGRAKKAWLSPPGQGISGRG